MISNMKTWFKKDRMEVLRKDVEEESANLERQILTRDLQIIDDQYRLQGEIAKRQRLLDWLNRDLPKVLNGQVPSN